MLHAGKEPCMKDTTVVVCDLCHLEALAESELLQQKSKTRLIVISPTLLVEKKEDFEEKLGLFFDLQRLSLVTNGCMLFTYHPEIIDLQSVITVVVNRCRPCREVIFYKPSQFMQNRVADRVRGIGKKVLCIEPEPVTLFRQ